MALLCMVVHFQEGVIMQCKHYIFSFGRYFHYKAILPKQCKRMWTVLEAFICGNKFYVFSTVIFS